MRPIPRPPLWELLELVEQTAKVEKPDDALQAVTQTVVRMLGGDHASIRLLDPSQRELLASARSGRGTHLGSLPLRPATRGSPAGSSSTPKGFGSTTSGRIPASSPRWGRAFRSGR